VEHPVPLHIGAATRDGSVGFYLIWTKYTMFPYRVKIHLVAGTINVNNRYQKYLNNVRHCLVALVESYCLQLLLSTLCFGVYSVRIYNRRDYDIFTQGYTYS
jgi:hypothetical protein